MSKGKKHSLPQYNQFEDDLRYLPNIKHQRSRGQYLQSLKVESLLLKNPIAIQGDMNMCRYSSKSHSCYFHH